MPAQWPMMVFDVAVREMARPGSVAGLWGLSQVGVCGLWGSGLS